ncbi:MAG: addiction module protein [Segetibacter sp.]
MALQEDLEFDDDILAEDELTPEQWKELDKRVKDAESGKAEFISIEDFKKS